MSEQVLPLVAAVCIAVLIIVLLAVVIWQMVEVSNKADLMLVRVAEIHNLTNSTLSRAQMDLQIAVVRVDALERLVSSLSSAKIVADQVANTLAAKVPVSVAVPEGGEKIVGTFEGVQKTP